MYDVVIIGSGSAGYTAAIYSCRAGRKTLLLAGSIPGGQLMLTSDVENFPGFPESVVGPELMERMRKQAERFDAEIVYDDASEVDFKSRPFKVPIGKNIKEQLHKKDGVFVAIGNEPNTSIFKGQIDLDPKGYIITHKETETNVPGVFAAGDVRDFRYRQAITAAADGCKAAMDADRFIGEHYKN